MKDQDSSSLYIAQHQSLYNIDKDDNKTTTMKERLARNNVCFVKIQI